MPLSAALIRVPGEVLLCYRSSDRRSYPAAWDFPGGHVEDDESAVNAVRREIIEEVGVSVQVEKLTETPDLRVHDRDLDLSLWAVREWEGAPVNCAPEEHARVDWLDINHASTMALAHPAYRRWLTTLDRDLAAE